jgi:protein-disulfide isomerase
MSVRLRVPVDAADHILGRDRASVTLVVYGDYEDSWCSRVQRTIDALRSALKGHLQLVFRHFPMTLVHPHAQHAAEVAEAAGDRGRFWQMHYFLFEHQQTLDDGALVGHAARLGLDAKWVQTTLRVHTYAQRVQQDFLGGVQSGVAGAPTLFINETRYDGPLELGPLVTALQGVQYDVRRAMKGAADQP